MRFLVRDDLGNPLRRFWSLEDAKRFCLGGYTIEVAPKPPTPPKDAAYRLALEACGESPF